MSVFYEEVEKRGPLTHSELDMSGGVPFSARAKGVRRAVSRNSTPGSSMRRGRQEVVLYIQGVHDPESVVRAYLEANPGWLDTNVGAVTRMFNGIDGELGDAWRRISSEYEVENTGGYRGSKSQSRDCPFCKKEVSALPDHLPCPEQ